MRPIILGCYGGASTSPPPLPTNADLIYSAVSVQNNVYAARVQTLSTSGSNNFNGVLLAVATGTQSLELAALIAS